MYSVKEIFYTLRGEGVHAGRAAVFCRFTGCNLWSGREQDRATATCRFCDTDFVGTDGTEGGKYITAAELARACLRVWGNSKVSTTPFIVLTGGEPALQVDADLVSALHSAGFWIAIETNGTIQLPHGIDWVCVSPKLGTTLHQTTGNELKLVHPQGDPEAIVRGTDFVHYTLQPMDVADPQINARNVNVCLKYCLANPVWKLSLQIHKLVGLP